MQNEIKCLICGKITDGDKALEHTRETSTDNEAGHNCWEIMYREGLNERIVNTSNR